MHAYVEFFGKTMVAVWLTAEATGGKSGIIGEKMSSITEALSDHVAMVGFV